LSADPNTVAPETDKSFLVLFFKKEHSSLLKLLRTQGGANRAALAMDYRV
jgi:hypothetical protein